MDALFDPTLVPLLFNTLFVVVLGALAARSAVTRVAGGTGGAHRAPGVAVRRSWVSPRHRGARS